MRLQTALDKKTAQLPKPVAISIDPPANRLAKIPLPAISVVTRPWLTAATLVASDLLALLLAGFIAIQIKEAYSGVYNLGLYPKLWPLVFLFPVVYTAVGMYSGLALYPSVALGPADELRRATLSTTIVYMGVAAATFLMLGPAGERAPYSRAIFLMAWALSMVLVPIGRSIARGAFAGKPWWGHPVMVLGAGATARVLLQSLQRNPWLGLKPVAVLDDDPSKHGELCGIPVMGAMDVAPMLAKQYGITYAIVAMPGATADQLRKIYAKYGPFLPHLLVIPRLIGFSSLWVVAKDLGGVVGLEVRQRLLLLGPRAIKKSLDLTLTMLLIVVLLLPLLLIAVWIKFDSDGPVFFLQKRPGYRGKPFAIRKFRTMYTDAARRMNQLPVEQRKEFEKFGKIKHDPRITPIGKWLRKFSIDELPQLWNVLVGEMSLVGPRAYLKSQLPRMIQHRDLIFQVRPGITGIWQISGRSTVPFEQRMELDAYYVRNWSVWLDLHVLAQTGWVVLFGKGAY